MEAEAALKDALAGATVIGATLQTTQTTASVYDASISEIEIRLAKLEKDRQRYQNLVQRNAATPIQLEQIETEYEATRKKLEATKRQQKAALSGVNEVSHRRESTEAAIQRATAALEMARLNLSYTVVVAPCDGKLGRRALEEGQFITAGQTITYILPDTQKWIVANYKETQVEKPAYRTRGYHHCRCYQRQRVHGNNHSHIRRYGFQVLIGSYRQFSRKLRQNTTTHTRTHRLHQSFQRR